ncbi:MAG TPA: DUF6569 family protein [Thermoanaerobaculia bacterium]|nr:DUF6569 family protein [Thermoanaerobaculia bacterium]
MKVSQSRPPVVLALAVLALLLAVQERSARGAPEKPAGGLRVEGPFVNQNLAIYTVFDRTADDRQYVTLADGMKARTVIVRERGASGGNAAVNELEVENKSDQWLFLQAGDVVHGGQQDRTIGIDVAIPPKSPPQPISAFCVEHGRWTGKASFDGTAAIVGSPKLKASIQGEKNQSAVWADVAAADAKAAVVVSAEAPVVSTTMSSTGSYSGIIRNREIQSKTADYVNPLLGRLEDSRDAVGLVVAINGELAAADVYGSPALFHKLGRKLVESYAREALLARDPKKSPPKAPSKEAALEFLDSVSRAQGRNEKVGASVQKTTRETSKAVVYEYTEPGDGSAGSGRLLHKSFVRK